MSDAKQLRFTPKGTVSAQEVYDTLWEIFHALTFVNVSHSHSCTCNTCAPRHKALALMYKIGGIDQATGEPLIVTGQ